MYKLLAIDLDGTLLSERKTISRENHYWLQKAADAGMIISFATGRGIPTVEKYLAELKIDVAMVLTNGAEIWANRNQLLERHFIDEEDIRRLHQLATEHKAHYWGYSTDGMYRRQNWKKKLFAYPWLKFGIRHNDLNVIEELRETVRQWGTLEVTYAAPVNMELTAKGISKASGVARLCQHLGITMDEVIAIGDSHNDAALFQEVGLAVAMGNAEPQIKQIAHLETLSENESGVAHAIEHFVLGKSS